MLSLLLPLFLPLLAVLLPLALIAGLLRTPRIKGYLGERWMRFLIDRHLPVPHYHALHDVTLPTVDGSTQIDHLLISRFGVFVLETKNMRGWIFGSEQQAQWTQKIYRHSVRFQNPLRQNYKHLKAVQALLELPDDNVHSVVNFVGSASLRTIMPANVTRGSGFIAHIKSFGRVVFDDEQVKTMLARLHQGRMAPGLQTRQQHLRHLQQRSDPQAQRGCPRCGNALVLRTRRNGNKAGQQFWGCSAYPRCRTLQTL